MTLLPSQRTVGLFHKFSTESQESPEWTRPLLWGEPGSEVNPWHNRKNVFPGALFLFSHPPPPPPVLAFILCVCLYHLHRANLAYEKQAVILEFFNTLLPQQLPSSQMFVTAVLAEVVNDTWTDRIQIDFQKLCWLLRHISCTQLSKTGGGEGGGIPDQQNHAMWQCGLWSKGLSSLICKPNTKDIIT